MNLRGQSTFHGPVNATVPRNPLFGCGVADGAGSDLGLLLLVVGAMLTFAGRASRKRQPASTVRTARPGARGDAPMTAGTDL